MDGAFQTVRWLKSLLHGGGIWAFSYLLFIGFPLTWTTEQEKILRDTLVSPLGSKYNFLCLYCVAATQFNPSNWCICLNQNKDSFFCYLVQKHEEPGSRHSSHQHTQSFFWIMGTSEDHVGIVMLARVSRQERQNCSCNLAPTLNFEDKEKWIIRLEKKNCLHMFIVIITLTYKWLLFSFFMFFTSFQISYNKQI